LTLFTILINIPAAIAAIYGMNVALPYGSSLYAFYYIIGFIIVLIVGFLIFVRKKEFF